MKHPRPMVSIRVRLSPHLYLGILGLALVSGLSAVAAADDTIDLRPGFVAGRTIYVSVEQTTTANVAAKESKSRSLVDYRFDIRSLAGDTAAVRLTYENASLEQERGTQKGAFDTRIEEIEGQDTSIGRLLETFVGKSINISYGLDGSVKELSGNEALKKAPAAPLLNVRDDDVFKRTLSKFFAPAGHRASAKVGDTWMVEERTKYGPGVDLVVKITMKLEKATEKEATIVFTGSGTFETAKVNTEAPPRFQKKKLEGRIVWDRQRRLVRRYETAFAFSIFSRSLGGAETELAVEQNQTTSVTLVEEP